MKSFIIHIDSLEILKSLNNEQAGKLFKAIKQYQEDQTIIEEDQLIKIALIPFVSQFKRDKEKYDNICKRNKENGKNGGRPKTEETQNNPVGYLETQKNPKNLKSNSNSNSNNKSNSNSNSNNKVIVQNENHFEQFWTYYTPIEQKDGKATHKGNKQEASIQYQKQLKKHTHAEIMQGLKKYLTFCKEKGQLTLQAVRFLKKQTFLDEFNVVIKPPTETEKSRAILDQFKNSI
jgi:hypothetical protein